MAAVIHASHHYPAIQLLDPQGEVQLTSGGSHDISAQTRTLLPSAFANAEGVQSELYLDVYDDLPSLNS